MLEADAPDSTARTAAMYKSEASAIKRLLPGVRIRTAVHVGTGGQASVAELRRRYRRAKIVAFDPSPDDYGAGLEVDDLVLRIRRLPLGSDSEDAAEGTGSGESVCLANGMTRISYLRIDAGRDTLEALMSFDEMIVGGWVGLISVPAAMNDGNPDHLPLRGFQGKLERNGYAILGVFRQRPAGAFGPQLETADVVFVSRRLIRRLAKETRPRVAFDGTAAEPSIEEAVPYLEASGWLRSRRERRSIDRRGRPVPWYTYSAIEFVSQRVEPSMEIFEFGSGGSTVWWAQHAAHVTAVEHHPDWFKEVSKMVPDNVELMHVPLETDGLYARAAQRSDRQFHVIVVDGRDRVNCAINSVDKLRDEGIVIWDNSDRERYHDGFRMLHERGFKRIGFHGHAPIRNRVMETSVFYRPDNCFGI